MHFSSHQVIAFLVGNGFTAFMAHMLATRPPINNPWVNWVVGGLQWLVGQRVSGANTVKGISSDVVQSAEQPVLQHIRKVNFEEQKEKEEKEKDV